MHEPSKKAPCIEYVYTYIYRSLSQMYVNVPDIEHMGLISGYQNGLERSLNATKKRVYWNSFASNGKATKNSSPEPNYHQHPSPVGWISQLVWISHQQTSMDIPVGLDSKWKIILCGWENIWPTCKVGLRHLTNFHQRWKTSSTTASRDQTHCIYASFFFFLKIIRAMKHSKDQHSDRIQGRPTFPNLPTFETSTTAGSLPVCLGCWRWRWHFYSSTTGSGAGGVDVVVSCFGCLKKTLKSDMAHGKSPCLIGNTEIHLQLWWIFHCHVGFSVVYWLEWMLQQCCFLKDIDGLRWFRAGIQDDLDDLNHKQWASCSKVFFFHIAFLGFELDVWRGG